MSVTVRIPAPLRSLTAGEAAVQLQGGSVSDILAQLEQRYPGMEERLRDPEGKLRRFVNLYVNGEDVRFLQGVDTNLKAGDEVSIIPAVAGGA